MLKILLTATVQSHICQFHKPLVEMLREHCDVEIHVAARNNLLEKNGLKLDFADKVYDVPFSRSPKSPDNIKAYKILKEIIEKEAYDIIHCNTPMGGIVTRLAARKARKAGTKVFYTAHGFHFYKGASKKNWMIYYPIEKLFAKYTDKLITINEEDFALARAKFKCDVYHIHGVGVDPSRYYSVSEDDQAAIKEKLGLEKGKRYILCVGELLSNKNQKMAIRAMEEVVKVIPDAVLLIAGNGPEKDDLSNLVSNLSLSDNVKLLGYITNLEEYQRVCELSVSCSKREGLGLNLIEAMLTENPVVATKNRGHNELIKNGYNGYLIDSDDNHALADRIVAIISDAVKSSDLKQNALEIGSKYTFDVVKKELMGIYFGT